MKEVTLLLELNKRTLKNFVHRTFEDSQSINEKFQLNFQS